ncbi:unnamed protein product [Peronospora farinosa]|uniref:Uncharacterized protein n=1 Tax=Peronospora farinosa TaxID=134698 RepID=A0AAV0UWM9_9STRA|nr:unnamed protein product [Peronospora farinosa]
MEEIVSSLDVLNDVTCTNLTAENHVEEDKIVLAMTQVLDCLHHQIATSPLHTEESYRISEDDNTSREFSMLKEFSQAFLCWHKKMEAINWRLWMLWMELGCTLDVLRCCEANGDKEESFSVLILTSRPPHDFPTSKTRFNKEKQVIYSRELWDAVVAKPLYEAPAGVVSRAAPRLIEAFLYWTTAAMRGYEVAFIFNVATPLREYFHSSAKVTDSPVLTDAWLIYGNSKQSAALITSSAASVAVTAVILSALTFTCRRQEVAEYLESLSAATVNELSRRPYPQPNSPIAGVAIALGLANLDDARLSSNPAAELRSENATILSQFTLLQLLSLPLMSTRLKPYDGATILEYQMKVHQRVKILVADPSHAILQEQLLRMTELCIEEMIGFFNTSLETYIGLIQAMQSVLPRDLFRHKLLLQLQSPGAPVVHDEDLLVSAPDVVEFIRKIYEGIAPMLKVLSSCNLVRSFLALSRVEFARKASVSPTANAAMESVTQQLEQALEQSATPSDTIFAPVLCSVTMHSMTVNSGIPPEIDIIAGCQSLAVGLVIQRRLRILLFQCTPLLNDALSVAFSVLYNVFEPADAFGHRFIGVCLSHLSQFAPLQTVFPHYLRLTLAAYPANASRQALTKACGVIFGSLFFSEALMMPARSDKTMVETTRQLVLWAIRKCCERSTDILVEEEKEVAIALVPTEIVKDSAKEISKETVASRETDGLYLAGLVFELMKMAPMIILEAVSMEAERLLYHWKKNPRVLRELKSALFTRISQNCEAEKRAWFATWYIYVDKLYPVETSCSRMVPSRL